MTANVRPDEIAQMDQSMADIRDVLKKFVTEIQESPEISAAEPGSRLLMVSEKITDSVSLRLQDGEEAVDVLADMILIAAFLFSLAAYGSHCAGFEEIVKRLEEGL